MKTPRTITTLIAIALFPPSLHAATTMLGFNSLPSAQGWDYHGSAPESSLFSVSGGVLTQDSIGIGHDPAYYQLGATIDPKQSFTVAFRARLLAEEFGNDPLAFAVQVNAGSQIVGVGLAQNGVAVFGPGSSTIFVDSSIDASQFHDYVLIGRPKARRWQLWVDGRVVGSGAMGQEVTGTAIYLGDLTDGGNARGEWAAFSFTQH